MSLLGSLVLPVVGAPMAGGVSNPLLAAAASDAGGLGMLAAGYRTPEQVAADLVHVRDLTDRPFGINLFVPRPLDRAALEPAVEDFAGRIAGEAAALGTEVGRPSWYDTDHWDAKVHLVETLAPPVVSCTFGIPGAAVVDRWKAAGCEVHLTATSVPEALAAAETGADVVVLQGMEAGGHRGTHDPSAAPEPVDHLGLLETVLPQVGVPLVVAGGVTTPGDVRRAFGAGAAGVQVGTALLLAPESGASRTYRAALRSPRHTERVLTRAFSGRVAGAVANGWTREYADAPAAFPVVDQLTKPLRKAAAEQGDLERIHVWAGSGWRAAQERPAGEIVRELAG
ncbi:Enoyl-acyl carrier protein reductase [Serinicoccus hydrothermalis]|uniref:Propionate 3-nitronate monooxygenase n=1 Tax=Serinicoccus hydrothermalis TaxID=1758689 RepID=A0A1B1N7T1_9MICO|nr:nitronate monooxygenase [Serinicoccus hydrothermalis]ANS77492.1 Enoyl-acyl carrier protein reductase [Serinicoccus hydrothermalis]